ncbi:MAG TPA: CDP-alcohol phosphatidyltransferase family protein, partial [Pseudonocardiaceae bacterium]|nr:CDP-alcohol phosphatidyltransferase family protein [Pseudonocardiaceae bacterium]
MLNVFARASVSRFLDPAGCWLFRVGIGPDAITLTGALGTVASALWFFPHDQLVAGTIAVTVFALFDLLDGAVARARGHSTPF